VCNFTSSNTDAGGLSLWLKSQSDSIVHAIPTTLQVQTALGINHYPWEKPAVRSRNTALYILLLLLGIGIIIFIFYRYPHHPDTAGSPAATDTVASAVIPAPAPAATDTVASPGFR
jgi:hypothetical protein